MLMLMVMMMMTMTMLMIMMMMMMLLMMMMMSLMIMMMIARYPEGVFGAVDAGRETAVRFFNEWTADGMREVPADRLLVFEVKHGWGPLCKFLGVPEPDTPFPNTNDTKERQENLRRIKRRCLLIWSLAAAAMGTAAYLLRDKLPVPTVTFN